MTLRTIERRAVVTAGGAPVAAVVATVMTAVGAGVGIRHMTTSGVTGTAVAGLGALLVGLALFAFAGGVFWHRTHRWQRLWLVPIAVLLLAVMSSVAIGTMLAWAPRNSIGSARPSDRGLSYSDVTFTSSDGVRLSAWFVPSHNQAVVITVPGSGCTRTVTLDQAAVLARHGYGVLLLDPRGQGTSGGHAMDAGWYGDRDVAAAVAYLKRRTDVDPDRIGVLGLSMGGEVAIGAAAVESSIRAVVAEGATHRTAADKAGYLPGGVLGGIQRGLDRLTYAVAALLSPAPEPKTLHSAIAGARGTSFLLIAAGKGVDEPEAAAYLRGAAPERVQTWTVPGSTHTRGLATAPADWEARVIGFFDGTLLTTG